MSRLKWPKGRPGPCKLVTVSNSMHCVCALCAACRTESCAPSTRAAIARSQTRTRARAGHTYVNTHSHIRQARMWEGVLCETDTMAIVYRCAVWHARHHDHVLPESSSIRAPGSVGSGPIHLERSVTKTSLSRACNLLIPKLPSRISHRLHSTHRFLPRRAHHSPRIQAVPVAHRFSRHSPLALRPARGRVFAVLLVLRVEGTVLGVV